MCGIAGIIAPKEPLGSLEPVLDGMLAGIKHRGPDDSGKHLEDGLSLGVRRLSIIDLTGGHQPIYSDDGQYLIICNGEIYNFPELRKKLEAKGHRFRTRSDTEVVLHGYMEWKERVVDLLNGMFALAIYDRPAGKLFLARDHFGIKPLYYIERSGLFAFCSEPVPLMQLPGMTRTLDLESLRMFLCYKYVPSPRTYIKEIEKFKPGMSMGIRVETLEKVINTYWRLTPEPMDLSIEEAEGRLSDLLVAAVGRQMISDVPLGVFLSGGIDSGLILWASRRFRGAGPLNAYTVGFSDRSFDESELASIAARHIGANHKVEYLPMPRAGGLDGMVERFGEPFANNSIPANFLLNATAAKHIKVALNGSGGDELFGGYDRYFAVQPPVALKLMGPFYSILYRIFQALPVGSKKHSLVTFARRFLELSSAPLDKRHALAVRLFMPDQLQKLFPDAPEMKDPVLNYFAEAPGDDLQKAVWTDILTMMADDYLALVDRISMAASLEVRVPFLDLELASFGFSLPSPFKIKNWEKKYLLRRFAMDRLPRQITGGSKRGFESPIGAWFRGPLGDSLLGKLQDSPLKRLLSVTYVEQLLMEHKALRKDASKHLLGLYTLVHWADIFDVRVS